MGIEIQERGWAGHFCMGHRCRYHRNTLVSFNEKRIVVSTVGNLWYQDRSGPQKIGGNRHYETMVFWAKKSGAYYDADVQMGIDLESDWCLKIMKRNENSIDTLADKMHETAVKEVVQKLVDGIL